MSNYKRMGLFPPKEKPHKQSAMSLTQNLSRSFYCAPLAVGALLNIERSRTLTIDELKNIFFYDFSEADVISSGSSVDMIWDALIRGGVSIDRMHCFKIDADSNDEFVQAFISLVQGKKGLLFQNNHIVTITDCSDKYCIIMDPDNEEKDYEVFSINEIVRLSMLPDKTLAIIVIDPIDEYDRPF
jgi:hypothetical protein